MKNNYQLLGAMERVKPVVVCLCGSTRFGDAFRAANLSETLAGKIVLTIGCDMRSDNELFAGYSPEELQRVKAALDQLHLHKIDLADEVLILNVGGYIGDSTRRELEYAWQSWKVVRFLEEPEFAKEDPDLIGVSEVVFLGTGNTSGCSPRARG